MTDRELLEFAAKAAGIDGFCVDAGINIGSNETPAIWNPLTDDGDALRLAAALDIDLEFQCPGVEAYRSHNHPSYEGRGVPCFTENSGDVRADARRAIVRAAAEIGKAMP